MFHSWNNLKMFFLYVLLSKRLEIICAILSHFNRNLNPCLENEPGYQFWVYRILPIHTHEFGLVGLVITAWGFCQNICFMERLQDFS